MKNNITQDNSYQIIITEQDNLLIDCYFTTLAKAKYTYDCIVASGVKTGLKIELYFRYYFYYVDQNNKVNEQCEHVLIDQFIVK